MRASPSVLALLLLVSSCGGEPSLNDYAEQAEQLVVTMNFGLDSLDELIDEPKPSLEDVRRYAVGRVELREEFLAGLKELHPPERVRDFHEAVVDIIIRLTAAETAMADEVLALEAGADTSNLWDSEAGRTAQAIDAEAVVFCRAAEAELDTGDQQAFGDDMPWIPQELTEVVRVAFYCDRSDRP